MRKLREAALVATMVGGVSMLGAGVASAHGGGEGPPRSVTINCNQDNGDNTTSPLGGLVTVTGPLVVVGTDSSATQNICGIDNDGNEVQGGDSQGGTASSVAGA